jgi:hypothetical protein
LLKPMTSMGFFCCSSLWQVWFFFAQAYDKYVFFLSVLHMFWWKCSLVYVYIFYISKDVKKKKKGKNVLVFRQST